MAVKGVPTMGWTSRSVAATILLVNQEQRQAMAQRVAALMDARGLTNESLAYKSGLSVKTVSRILNARHDSRIGTVEKIATALGVTELDLRGEPVAPLGLSADGGSAQLDRMEAKLDQLLAAVNDESGESAEEAARAVDAAVAGLEEAAAESPPKPATVRRAKSRAAQQRRTA